MSQCLSSDFEFPVHCDIRALPSRALAKKLSNFAEKYMAYDDKIKLYENFVKENPALVSSKKL